MARLGQNAGRLASGILILAFFWIAGCSQAPAGPQYAAMVMDARTGKVLHSRNADTRLHPASLTKMMTLYVAFEAIEHGEISLDTKVRVSRNAAAQEPSKIYLKAGQTIEMRYLLRASAVKSANDAAVVIAEAIEGSVPAFARRMNRTAKALGMTRTTFKNPHGLTTQGHLSTARDMTILGRHVFYDYPEYYNLFSRRTADVKVTTVANTNRRLLNAYRGADGIKTGYTRAAGSNLVASAERGGVRIIATMFGGSSSAARNARVAELLDLGFARAPTRVAVAKPAKPNYALASGSRMTLAASAVPMARPLSVIARAEAEALKLATLTPPEPVAEAVELALLHGAVTPAPRPDDPLAEAVAEVATTEAEPIAADAPTETDDATEVAAVKPAAAVSPETVTMRRSIQEALAVAAVAPVPEPEPVLRPARRPAQVTFSTSDMPVELADADASGTVVMTRDATRGGWGVRVGRYGSRYQAERVLLRTALQQVDLLSGSRRSVVSGARGWEVQFSGLSRSAADLACQRLASRDELCSTFGS